MRKILAIGLAVAALAFPALAPAQPTGSVQAISPLTRDLGSVKTMALQPAATITSADQNGYNVSRVVCVFRQSTFSGTPSTTFKIQNKDAASGQYYDLVTSSAITSSTSPSAIAAGAGVATASNTAIGFPIAQRWRVSITVGGSATPLVTGTVGCSVQ